MCDYSLHAHANRLAREDEELVLTRFPGGSMGFISDCQHQEYTAWANRHSQIVWNWNGIVNYWRSRNASRPKGALEAVCLPPGATLELSGLSPAKQTEYGVGPTERVKFAQITCDPYAYRDAVEFRNGKRVLLQNLSEKTRVRVLTLECIDVEAVEVPAETVAAF